MVLGLLLGWSWGGGLIFGLYYNFTSFIIGFAVFLAMSLTFFAAGFFAALADFLGADSNTSGWFCSSSASFLATKKLLVVLMLP